MAALVSNVINLLLSLIPLALLVPIMRHPFYWTWLYLPVPMLALAIFTLGAIFFFAAAMCFTGTFPTYYRLYFQPGST